MAQTYTRQSTFADGDTITAALFNDEYNQLVNAFAYSSTSATTTGHRHDGTAGQGGNIPKIGDLDFLNKIEVDGTNNRWGFYVEVSSAAVEQIRIQDGAIVPVTDSDIDLGTSSLEFKDLFIDGTATIDTLTVDEAATIGTTLGVTGATTLSSTLGVTGATTLSSTLAVTGAATLSSTLAVTGTSTLTGNVTATNDLSVGGNLTVTGNATISGNLTFGDADTDSITLTADVASNITPDADNTYDLGSSTKEWKDLYIDGIAYLDAINFNGTAISATAAELNIMDGVTATATEINLLDGVTSTTAELNILDGVTSTASELNLVDGSSAGTIVNSKAVVYGSAGEVNATTLQVGGVSITSTPAELNILDGVTATTAELNILDGVTSTAAELNILDGVTSTTAELNILDGVTATAAELNVLDGVTAFVDEDDMSSDSATSIPSQQSVKAYVDSQVASADTLAELTDTNITTPADGALLFYDTGTSKWIDNVVSGDITIADTGVAAIGSGVIVNADVNASAAIDVSKTALTAGTGLTLTTNTLSVDAAQTQITSVGTLSSLSVSGTLTSGDITVTDATPFIRLQDSDVTNGYTQISNINGNGYIGARNDSADGSLLIGGYGGGTFTEFARWSETGNLTQIGPTTFTGDVVISEATPSITLDDADNADGELQIVQSTGSSFYRTRGVSGNGAHVFQRNDGTDVLKIFQTNTSGDVIFYDDDGSTEGMRWDASTDRLGILDGTPASALQVGSSSTEDSDAYITFGKRVASTETNFPFIGHDDVDGGSHNDLGLGVRSNNGTINFYTGNSTTAFNSSNTRMTIDSTGVVTFDNGISEEYTAVTSSSNSTTVNLQDGTNFSHTLSENTTFTFSNPASSGKVSAFTLKLVQDASASGYTVTWPTEVDWPSATAPTLTSTASAVDYFVFITHDGGTTYYGFTAGQALG